MGFMGNCPESEDLVGAQQRAPMKTHYKETRYEIVETDLLNLTFFSFIIFTKSALHKANWTTSRLTGPGESSQETANYL